MPTKKKRVGFIPREDVMKIIDKLSIENNLSNSKIISLLVEEALSVRGIFNKKTGKVNKSYQGLKDDSDYFSKDYTLNDKFKSNNTFENNMNSDKTAVLKQTNQEDFDLQTYKKFLSFLKFQEMMEEYKA